MPNISPQAIVEDGARLADDVIVGPFSYVGPDVTVAAGCVIENNVTLVGQTALGPRNHVFPMAVIGLGPDAQGAGTVCRVGQANSIREHVTIYGGLDRPTLVGSDNLFMIDCTIGAGARIGDHCIFANVTHVGDEAVLEDYTHTSGFAAIESRVTVGAYTFIAGYTGIDRDAPPYAIVQGYPFRVRGVNTHKLRRCGFGDADIRDLKDAFRDLYNSQGDRPETRDVAALAARSDLNPHVRRLVELLAREPAEEDAS